MLPRLQSAIYGSSRILTISQRKEDDLIIQLRATDKLKVIFMKLINTLGTDIQWTGVFVINNNNLILVGSDSVWIFDFGNKMLACNSYEMHLKEENILLIPEDELLENVLNMTLYAFGKWGKIKGLTVENDYPNLNDLFGNFLSEIHVEPVMTVDWLRFYKNGVQITYEDIIQNVLDRLLQDDTEKENKDDRVNDAKEENYGEFNKGLWHKVVWKSEHTSFVKESMDKSDQLKTRIGNNFYMVSYKCPECGEKLFMVVYPMGKEYLIETDEKGVYMARAYTCYTCHRMYTPKPQMLLLDGDVFSIDFEDDTVAYEDYLEVIGEQGERTFNSNFNEYEVDYNRETSQEEEQIEEICSDMESMTNQDIFRLQEKMDSGFYPEKSIDKFQYVVDAEVKSRKRHVPNKTIKEYAIQKKKDRQDLSASKPKVPNRGMMMTSYKIESDNRGRVAYGKKLESDLKTDSHFIEKGDEKLEHSGNSALPIKEIEGLGAWKSIKTERFSDKKDNGKLKFTVSRSKEEELDLVEECKDKNYANILRIMNEIRKEDFNQDSKDSLLYSLKDLLEKKGNAELNAICLKIPNKITKAQYIQYTQIIEQYDEIDNTPYKKRLELIRGEAEKREITAYIKQSNAKDRESLTSLYNKLEKEDFEERNVAPFLENINEKIYALDENLIRKICPEPADLTFEAGLKAYEEISGKELLPQLKENILSKIDNRLRKIKMNECEQLINKLAKEMGNQVQNHSRIHFYDVRKGMSNNHEDEEIQIMIRAQNTYAVERGKYEFPILICDTSFKRNGEKGFILTPDHIFYNSMVNSGTIDINNVEELKAMKGIFTLGIYADTLNEGEVRLSNSLELNNLKKFAGILNDFISYLKEKPESRDISYMAQEKHKVKCCYRCGFVYHGDKACPKCGAKIND